MLTVYTSNKSLGLSNVQAMYEFPERNKDPWEQMSFVDDVITHMHDMGDGYDTSITTFSPYILNYFNLLLKRGDLKPNELNVIEYYFDADANGEISEFNLMINENNTHLVDTRVLSEPISWIYEEYNKLK